MYIRVQLILSFLIAVLLCGSVASESVYMVLEQTSSGKARNYALDRSMEVDGFDPVALHILSNTPTDPETAQVLWVATEQPLWWRPDAENADFKFVEHAVLPDDAVIEYRVHRYENDFELISRRHQRNASSTDWDVKASILNTLPTDSYYIVAELRVPGRPVQELVQRLEVSNDDPNILPEMTWRDVPGVDLDIAPYNEPLGDAFTPLVPSVDTQVIYVSESEGDDNNDGLSEQTPVKTLARGWDLLRDDKPDWLLLKRGDFWNNESFDGFDLAGRSADEPMVISTYGAKGARPLIVPPHGSNGFKNSKTKIDGLVIQGLHFYAATRDPGSHRFLDRDGEVEGINVRIGASDGKFVNGLIIEDCIVTHFDTNIKIVDDASRMHRDNYDRPIPGVAGRINVKIRRNIVRFASGTDSHSVGVYIEGTIDSVIEENLIDHNGWTQVDGVQERNKRSHNIYAQSFNGPLTVRNNIIARGAANGLQLRAGGDIENNLFVRNALAFWTSTHNSKARYNVILESDDINPDVPADRRGVGLEGWNMQEYLIKGNIVAHRVGQLQRPGIDVNADKLYVYNNIVYNWNDNTGNSFALDADERLVESGNQAPEFYTPGETPNYVDPTRSVGSYAGTIDLDPTLDAFLDFAANRPRGVWVYKAESERINAYIRAGFDIQTQP